MTSSTADRGPVSYTRTEMNDAHLADGKGLLRGLCELKDRLGIIWVFQKSKLVRADSGGRPISIRDVVRNRLDAGGRGVALGGLEIEASELKAADEWLCYDGEGPVARTVMGIPALSNEKPVRTTPSDAFGY